MPDSDQITQNTSTPPELPTDQATESKNVPETSPITNSENTPHTQSTIPPGQSTGTEQSSNAVDETPKNPYKRTWDRNRGHIRELKRKRHGNCKNPVKRPYKIWTEDEDKLLTLSYTKTTDAELEELFPDRTKDSIDQRAYRLGLVKAPEVRAQILSANACKYGIANFADYPVEALAKKYPDLKQAYDAIMERLLCHPAVNPNDVLQVELLKEAALHKVTQFMLMKDRIDNDLKGKTLMFNPKNGMEHWVESRYPQSPDITNDSKMARQILKDLGIIEEKECKVDVTAHLKMLWEEPTDEQEGKSGKEETGHKPKAD
jgi:hypothetical protein